jgi:DNA-binding response OmpR family regulator
MSWSDSLESAVLESGADGFVRKTFRQSELIAAIVAAGRSTDPA